MNEETEEVGAFHKIVWGDIKPPEKVRCMLCGRMIELETIEGGFDVVLWIYSCFDCRYWLEWELAGDEDDDIYSSLWLIDMDDEEQESESCRGREHYWEPNEDGYTAPEFEQKATAGKE